MGYPWVGIAKQFVGQTSSNDYLVMYYSIPHTQYHERHQPNQGKGKNAVDDRRKTASPSKECRDRDRILKPGKTRGHEATCERIESK